jgi:hypothetical protein
LSTSAGEKDSEAEGVDDDKDDELAPTLENEDDEDADKEEKDDELAAPSATETMLPSSLSSTMSLSAILLA